MQSNFEARVSGGKGNSSFKINIPKTTAYIQDLANGDAVRVSIEKIPKK